jgi:hypothetical protein
MKNNDFSFNSFGFEKLHLIANNLTNILLTEATELPIPEILAKICVSPPYFAFKKIYKYGDILIAPIIVEQQLGNEATQISVGEVCRHLAILGTCSAAISQTEKYYYLARQGVVNRAKNADIVNNKQNSNKLLYAITSCDSSDSKSAKSSGLLVNSMQEIILDVEVGYSKISSKLFGKIFSQHFKNTNNADHNPYTGIIEFTDVKIENDCLTAIIPILPNEYCAGHFAGCPAIPIAFCAHNITRYAGELLSAKTGIKNYLISKANLLSIALHFPNIYNKVKIQYDGFINNEHNLTCTTEQNNKNVSTLTLSMVGA